MRILKSIIMLVNVFLTASVKEIFFRLFCCLIFFFSFYYLNALKDIITVIQFIFLGINIFWALLRAHFDPHLTARAKMSLSGAQIIFAP